MLTTIACVLKSGGQFKPEHVEILKDSIARNCDAEYQFAVLTDEPTKWFSAGTIVLPLVHDLPGWWSKMELFSPRVREALGDTLYFDLDTLICGPVDELVVTPTKFTILRDFYRPEGYGSGMMFIPAEYGADVWREFASAHDLYTSNYRGDQDFLEAYAKGADLWQDVCPKRVQSFKPAGFHLAAPPKGCSVICFHGFPRPWELPQDHWTRKFWRRTETWDQHVLGDATGAQDL